MKRCHAKFLSISTPTNRTEKAHLNEQKLSVRKVMLMITIRWGFSFSRQLCSLSLRKAIYFASVAITNQAGTQKERKKKWTNIFSRLIICAIMSWGVNKYRRRWAAAGGERDIQTLLDFFAFVSHYFRGISLMINWNFSLKTRWRDY